jgi:hypothetical protein
MPRVVPSQVVALIDQIWPKSQTDPDFPVYPASAGVLSAIVRLTNEIPSELLTIEAEDYTDLVHGLEELANAVNRWLQRGGNDPPARIRGRSPVSIIRGVLAECPDESPSPNTATLTFILDDDLRQSIRLDISAANRDAENGEWKGATVLAGSATEALLLWAIQEAERKNPGITAKAVTALTSDRTITRKPKSNPEEWDFIELIEVARRLTLVKDESATECRLCKDFRNLIHPGRATRLGQVCDRGTALVALAAVELVVRDLTPASGGNVNKAGPRVGG